MALSTNMFVATKYTCQIYGVVDKTVTVLTFESK